MWTLAWVLGFEPEPTLGRFSGRGTIVTGSMIHEFLPGLDGTVAGLVPRQRRAQRTKSIAMEYRFYCAHNAGPECAVRRPDRARGFPSGHARRRGPRAAAFAVVVRCA